MNEAPPQRSPHSDHSSLQGILKSSLGAGGALAPALFFGLWGQRPPENLLGAAAPKASLVVGRAALEMATEV